MKGLIHSGPFNDYNTWESFFITNWKIGIPSNENPNDLAIVQTLYMWKTKKKLTTNILQTFATVWEALIRPHAFIKRIYCMARINLLTRSKALEQKIK